MHVTIDAWLERKDPQIRLLDADTGQELLRLKPKQVRELVASGDLCPDDLESEVHTAEVIVLLQKRRVVRQDPTRLRAPAYMKRSRFDLQPMGNFLLSGGICHV